MINNDKFKPKDSGVNLGKKTKTRRILSVIAVALCIAALIAGFLLMTGVLDTYNGESDKPEVITDPFIWPEVIDEPFTILKVNTQSEETSPVYLWDYEYIDCVKCECEILYYQFREAYPKSSSSSIEKIYQEFNGTLYIPVKDKDNFAPGSVFLTIIKDREINYKKCFMPLISTDLKLEYFRFIDDSLMIYEEDWRTYSLYHIREINEWIDQRDKLQSDGKDIGWLTCLPSAKLESGMNVKETGDFLASLLPAAEAYWDIFYSKND